MRGKGRVTVHSRDHLGDPSRSKVGDGELSFSTGRGEEGFQDKVRNTYRLLPLTELGTKKDRGRDQRQQIEGITTVRVISGQKRGQANSGLFRDYRSLVLGYRKS